MSEWFPLRRDRQLIYKNHWVNSRWLQYYKIFQEQGRTWRVLILIGLSAVPVSPLVAFADSNRVAILVAQPAFFLLGFTLSELAMSKRTERRLHRQGKAVLATSITFRLLETELREQGVTAQELHCDLHREIAIKLMEHYFRIAYPVSICASDDVEVATKLRPMASSAAGSIAARVLGPLIVQQTLKAIPSASAAEKLMQAETARRLEKEDALWAAYWQAQFNQRDSGG